MNLRLLFLFFLVIFSLTQTGSVFSYSLEALDSSGRDEQISEGMAQVCFEHSCFFSELAVSEASRKRGLMHRKDLPSNGGMLFVNEAGEYPGLWMKNMLIPLDMVWIDKNERVVHIVENALPCTPDVCEPINPKVESKYVLELNAGTVNAAGIRIGERANIEFFYDQPARQPQVEVENEHIG